MSDTKNEMFDSTGEGHVPDNFREKMKKMNTPDNAKKLNEAISPASEEDIEEEKDDIEDEEEEEESELSKQSKTQVPTPAMSSRDPMAALAQVSPGAKQFVADFGDKYTDAIKRYTQSDILHVVEDKNGNYEYKGKRYRYRLKFQDPPSEVVEQIDLKFARANEAETETEIVKRLAKAYVFAFATYYGCDEEIPRKMIGKAQLRSIVDSLNWLERQGFR